MTCLQILNPMRRRHSVANISDYASQWGLLQSQWVKSDKPSYWVTGIDWEVFTFSVARHIQASTLLLQLPVFLTEWLSPSLCEGSSEEQERLQFFWDTAIQDKILTATVSAERGTRRCATSPLWISSGHCHFISGINGTKGLTGIRVNTQYLPKANYLNGRHLVRRERYNAHFQALYYWYEWESLPNISLT